MSMDDLNNQACGGASQLQCLRAMKELNEEVRRISQTLISLDRMAAQQQAHNEHRDALLARLSRVVLEGNGMQSLVSRVEDLEDISQKSLQHTSWVNDLKGKIIVALSVSFIMGLTAFVGTLFRDHSLNQLSAQVKTLIEREAIQNMEREKFLHDYYGDSNNVPTLDKYHEPSAPKGTALPATPSPHKTEVKSP